MNSYIIVFFAKSIFNCRNNTRTSSAATSKSFSASSFPNSERNIIFIIYTYKFYIYSLGEHTADRELRTYFLYID